MLLEAQREGSRTVPETGEDRDVYISIAQVAFVMSVFFLTLYYNCMCMSAVLLCVIRAALTAPEMIFFF